MVAYGSTRKARAEKQRGLPPPPYSIIHAHASLSHTAHLGLQLIPDLFHTYQLSLHSSIIPKQHLGGQQKRDEYPEAHTTCD